MTQVISIHSFRGGTGKSNTTANVAARLTAAGARVAVIDTDIQSPGVHVIFGFDDTPEPTLNDYLWGKVAIADAAHQITDQVNKLASKLAALIGMDLTTLAAMPQRVTEIAMQLETAHRANLIQLAASQGKVVPASALPGKDGKGGMAIPALETLISELPATVPVEQRTPMGAALVALTAGAGTVADSEPPPVAKQAGITKEQWQADGKKYGRG